MHNNHLIQHELHTVHGHGHGHGHGHEHGHGKGDNSMRNSRFGFSFVFYRDSIFAYRVFLFIALLVSLHFSKILII